MQELEPYGAVLSLNIGWSQRRKYGTGSALGCHMDF
jgi:hypothetical protein